ncbi:hypothetical protein LSTR_LSTR005867 [Laodelphax striatellus]|uniref:Uncharacterized protein n=1 Tax=Laodelphax striatellus TaxID=195883 RepID=A0A482WSA2_LAOST|nr:hypothetical protein LSTR_LSTR005867 [Laodelphax striatellus]
MKFYLMPTLFAVSCVLSVGIGFALVSILDDGTPTYDEIVKNKKVTDEEKKKIEKMMAIIKKAGGIKE